MTDLDRDILDIYRRAARRRRPPPTYREVADEVGCSPQHVHRRVAILVEQGLVERDPMRARSVRAVMKAPEATL